MREFDFERFNGFMRRGLDVLLRKDWTYGTLTFLTRATFIQLPIFISEAFFGRTKVFEISVSLDGAELASNQIPPSVPFLSFLPLLLPSGLRKNSVCVQIPL